MKKQKGEGVFRWAAECSTGKADKLKKTLFVFGCARNSKHYYLKQRHHPMERTLGKTKMVAAQAGEKSLLKKAWEKTETQRHRNDCPPPVEKE